MTINDPEKLVRDCDMLRKLVATHPLAHGQLDAAIEALEVKRSNDPSIEYDIDRGTAILRLGPHVANLPEYEYILLHEFAHVADRIAPSFGYSDQKRNALDDCGQLKLMEIWNIYIDARLNYHGLFKLGKNDRDIYCTIDGKLQKAPYSIEGKLQRHISFLRSRRMTQAEATVREIWGNPQKPRTYADLISLVKR
jgi:hypothetical protein